MANRVLTKIKDTFTGAKGRLYIGLSLAALFFFAVMAVPAVNRMSKLIDGILTSDIEGEYIVATAVVVAALACMGFDNVFSISAGREDPKFRRVRHSAMHITLLVLVTVALRVFCIVVMRPGSLIEAGEVSGRLFWLFGRSPVICAVINCVLSVVTVLGIYFLGYILSDRWNAAFSAAMTAAVWPQGFMSSSVAGTEVTMLSCAIVLTLLAGCGVITRAVRRERNKWIVAAGLVLICFGWYIIMAGNLSIGDSPLVKLIGNWAYETSAVDQIAATSVKPSASALATAYDLLSGSPLVFKLIAQVYYVGMVFVSLKGVIISIHNEYTQEKPAIAVMFVVLMFAALTVFTKDSGSYHMPAVAALLSLSALNYTPVEPDYEGL